MCVSKAIYFYINTKVCCYKAITAIIEHIYIYTHMQLPFQVPMKPRLLPHLHPDSMPGLPQKFQSREEMQLTPEDPLVIQRRH